MSSPTALVMMPDTLTIEKSSDNSLTRILDLTSTPTYVGPLDQTRVRDEQAQADYDETDTAAPGYITGTLSADAVATDATQFDGNLGPGDTNVQIALEMIDSLVLGGGAACVSCGVQCSRGGAHQLQQHGI